MYFSIALVAAALASQFQAKLAAVTQTAATATATACQKKDSAIYNLELGLATSDSSDLAL